MDFNNMSDEQIIEVMAANIEKMRISKQISAQDMAKKGGYNSQTYSNFINRGSNVRLGTIIQMFRGIGELDKLQKVFEYKKPYSPTDKSIELPRRVFKKTAAKTVKWGDEE